MADFILALDQGTTSSRAILFDQGGEVRAIAQQEFDQSYPERGWVEHDPEEIWDTQLAVAREALSQAGITARDVVALGITNQRETAVVWEASTGKPIHPAIVWQDRRTAGRMAQLAERGLAGLVESKTGLVLDSYFSASKIAWILDNVDGARRRAREGELRAGTIDTWLIYNLTGGSCFVTDVTNASRTMLFDINSQSWDSELLELFEIPRKMLPEVGPSSHVYGETTALDGETPIRIAGIAGDQQAATFGQACFAEGQGKCTYGTGAFILMNTGPERKRSTQNLLSTTLWQVGERPTYALEGSIFVAGAVVQWLRDELQIIRDAAEVEELARSVPDSNGVMLVPAFTGLGAPHWDSYARGTVLGLTRGSNRAHIARAALDSIAHQVADVTGAMESDTGLPLRELRVDGGAARNDLLMQHQANILGLPVVRPAITETTALGAAYLAGLAVGFWSGKEQISAQWKQDAIFEPQMEAQVRDSLREEWVRAVERAKGWAQP